ncbi:MAG: hypothetical protein HQL75_15835 [Magnetococcales bacterium]|nr:hypothetical protein [Magnetococcales bacterium]
MTSIWVVIVCDDSFFGEKLGSVLTESPDFVGADWVDFRPNAVRQALEGSPDLVIVEVDSLNPAGFQVIDHLHQGSFPFIAMAVAGDPEASQRAMDAGALAVFEREELFSAAGCKSLTQMIPKAFQRAKSAALSSPVKVGVATRGRTEEPKAVTPGISVAIQVHLVGGSTSLAQLLTRSPRIVHVWQSGYGAEAVETALRVRPDVLLVNLDQPMAKGLETIALLVNRLKLPLMALCPSNEDGIFFQAYDRGAQEVVEYAQAYGEGFIEQLVAVSRTRSGRQASPVPPPQASRKLEANAKKTVHETPGILAIASSTGGPKALVTFLGTLPSAFRYPVLIAQHIHPDYIGGLETWLRRATQLNVAIVEQGARVTPGTVHIAPATGNVEVKEKGVLFLSPKRAEDVYTPSCDRLLISAARVYGSQAIGVILTGMGQDGVAGIAAIKNAGGYTLAQDRESSMVFSMPGTAIERKLIDAVATPEQLGMLVMKQVYGKWPL